jgi:hypothetical protein
MDMDDQVEQRKHLLSKETEELRKWLGYSLGC